MGTICFNIDSSEFSVLFRANIINFDLKMAEDPTNLTKTRPKMLERPGFLPWPRILCLYGGFYSVNKKLGQFYGDLFFRGSFINFDLKMTEDPINLTKTRPKMLERPGCLPWPRILCLYGSFYSVNKELGQFL